MQPLRYSINVSLDGCVDHASAAFRPEQAVHQHAADWLARHDVAMFGRVTYELMEAWRPDAEGRLADWVEPWMVPFAETIGHLPKLLVSTTRQEPGWNTEVVDGDLLTTVRAVKARDGAGIAVGGVTLPLELARAGLIDEYQLVVHPSVAGHGPYLFAGLDRPLDLELVDRLDVADGVVAMRYVPRS